MDWPDSVNPETLGFKKPSRKGRPRKDATTRYTKGQLEEARRKELYNPYVSSGVTLETGSRGSACLQAVRADEGKGDCRGSGRRGDGDVPYKRWEWRFANKPGLDHRLQVSEDSAEFFPPTIHVDDDPPKKEERQETDDLQEMVDVEEKKTRQKSKPSQKTRQKKENQQKPADRMEIDQAPVSQRTRSRSASTVAQQKPVNPRIAALAQSGTNLGKRKPRGDSPGDEEEPECDDEEYIPATSAAESEEDDVEEVAAPPGQRMPALTPLSTAPPVDDDEEEPEEEEQTIEAKQARLKLGDNRNALATIKYEVKVKPNLFGFESHTLYFLAFAMGEKGNELNISSIKTSPQTRRRSPKIPTFIPSPRPSFICHDRILQISVSNKRRFKYPYICLAVRTETLVYMLVLTPSNTSVFPYAKSKQSVQVEMLSVIDSSGLEGALAVDIHMHPSHFQQCLIVTDAGTLYRWSMIKRILLSDGFVHEGKLVRIMTVPDDVKFDIAPRFYRAAWGIRQGTVVFMNATHMWYLDLQAEKTEKLVISTLDLAHTTSLFMSLDRTAVERDVEFMSISTTERVMWLDAHDARIALSWMHGRKGEKIHLEMIATSQDTGSAFLLRSSDNPKGTFFHIRDTMTGIQSVIDPYDCLLGKTPNRDVFPADGFVFSETYEIVPLNPDPPLRSQIGYATLAIPEAPTPLNLLLGLNEEGQLTCKVVEDPSADDTEESSEDEDFEQTRRSSRGIQPKQLLSRLRSDDDTDGSEIEDMDVDEGNEGTPKEDLDLVVLVDKAAWVREVWRSLGKNDSDDSDESDDEVPLASLASVRNFLNDDEHLQSTGFFTLHELLAMSCEVPEEGVEQRAEVVKGFSLELLQNPDPDGAQVDDLVQQFSSILNRADLCKVDVLDAARSIQGDQTLASNTLDAQQRLLERYLPVSDEPGHHDNALDVTASLKLATVELLCDIKLSAPAFVYRNSEGMGQGEDDDQMGGGVESKATKHLPTEYLKPKFKKKTLNDPGLSTIKSLVGQWNVGTSVSEYKWPGLSNWREPSPEPDDGKPSAASIPRSQPASARVRASSLRPLTPPPIQSPSRPPDSAGPSRPRRKHQSQVHFAEDTQSQTQDFASTQLVSGPHGNRKPVSFRRPLAKKRRTGF